MKKLKWINLKSFKCPYCDAGLQRHDDGDLSCTQCFFVIDNERYQSMIENRRQVENTKIQHLRWQNILEERCPACGDLLNEPQGIYAILNCLNIHCNFHIREDSLKAILADKSHIAYTYAKKIDEEIDKLLEEVQN